jgi:hypothetical protein
MKLAGSVGLGVILNEDGNFGHGGSNIGFRRTSLFFPASGSGIIVMTNGDNGGPLADEIMRMACLLSTEPCQKQPASTGS